MGGLALRNPVASAPHLRQSSVDACDILVKALHNGGGLSAEAHKACVWEAGNQARKARLKEEETYLDGLKVSGGRRMAKHLERMGKTGACYRPSPIALMVRSCRGRSSKTTSPFAMAYALEAFQNAAMDATNPFWWSTGAQLQEGGFCGTAA
jgi:hypothetical protein